MTVPPNLPQTGLKGCNIISISYTLKVHVYGNVFLLRGHPFMTPPPSVHRRPHDTNPPPSCGRPHIIDMKYI